MWEGGGRLIGNKAPATARCCYLHVGKGGFNWGFGSSPSIYVARSAPQGPRYHGDVIYRNKETLVLRIGPILTSFTPGGQHMVEFSTKWKNPYDSTCGKGALAIPCGRCSLAPLTGNKERSS